MGRDSRHSHYAWSLAFWATTIAAALPLLTTRFLPFTDTPEHTAAIATIARLLPGGGGAPYELALSKSQYLLFHGAGAILTRVFGDAMTANTTLLVLSAGMWPVALRSLLRAFGRDERLAIFGGIVFWNRATIVGLEPYIASVPILCFCLALFVRELRSPSVRRTAGFLGLTIALFYTHASSYLLLAIIAVSLAIRRRRWRALAMLVPSAIVALIWARAFGLNTTGPNAVERMSLLQSLVSMPLWTFDVWSSHVDEITASLFWIAYAVLVVTGWRSATNESSDAWVPVLCTLVVYLVIPTRIGDASMLNVRLAPILTLFALLGLRVGKSAWARVALGLAMMATFANSANASFEIARVEREMIGNFETVLAAMKPHTRLALLNLERKSVRTFEAPYPFVGAYHVARGGAVASFSFAELPHWSVQYARNAAPPAHAPFWAYDPCEYRFREDGRYYDYVLVQGEPQRFEVGLERGPHFSPIAHAARFTLFAKDGSDSDDDEPDTGPCDTGIPE